MNYTCIQHDDNLVEIVETGGLFFGYTVDQVRQAASQTQPNYQHNNLSYTFSDQYFNYSVRRTLLCLELQPITTSQPMELDSLTTLTESGKNKPSTNTDSLSD
jgi:hypothetical protein